MNGKLKKSPLTYVLAQIKFSEKLNMEENIASLQEAIRDDFSEYKDQMVQSIDLANDSLNYSKAKAWHFIDKNFTTAIMVTTDSISIQTSKYTTFEDLMNKLENVLIKFNKILDIKLYLRIGLRYVNFIHTNIKESLIPELLGYTLPDKNIFEDIYLARSETVQKTKSGTIKVNAMHMSSKSIIKSDNFYITPELGHGTNVLSFDHYKNKEPKKEYVILDIDHFTEEKGDFTAKNIIKKISQLHEGSFIAFCNAIKKKAWNKWK